MKSYRLNGKSLLQSEPEKSSCRMGHPETIGGLSAPNDALGSCAPSRVDAAGFDEIITGSIANPEQLAKRERCSLRQVNLTLSLAFLAPQLVKAAIEGRLPRGINIERLRDPHAEWNRQYQELGLDPH